ncbi:MAG: RasGEF domain-containing protein [Gammaproteobacteria bacterium]
MSGSNEQSKVVEGALPEKPTLKDILLYSKTADGQIVHPEDRRKAIGKFAYGLPQIMKAEGEKDFSENLIDALRSICFSSKPDERLKEDQLITARNNIGLLVEELYRNQCINQGDFHAVCLRCQELLPGNEKAFLKKMDAIDIILQAKLKQDKEKVPERADLSEVEIDKVKQTAESIRAQTIQLFSKLTPMDFYGQKWAKKKGTPLNEITEFFNKISSYVISDILSQGSVKEVEQRAVFWGDVLEHALNTKDYNTSMAILSAFNNSAIHLLNITTLENFEGKVNLEATLEKAKRILSSDTNYSNYRRELEKDLSSNIACVPFFGCYQTDYTFIDDGKDNRKNDGGYNYDKGSFISTLISSVVELQTKSIKEKYLYKCHGNIIPSIQNTATDTPVNVLEARRNLIRLDKSKRNYGTVDSFLSNLDKKHYNSETNNYNFPLYISLRVKKNESDENDLQLLDDISSHQFIQGELSYQLAGARKDNNEIDNKKVLAMIDALIKNAEDRGLPRDIINDYESLRVVVVNRNAHRKVEIEEDKIVLLALKHSIVHDLPEQEALRERIANHKEGSNTIKALVKERVALINKKLVEISKELKVIEGELKKMEPSSKEYEQKIERLRLLKKESYNYFINLCSIQDAYLRDDFILSKTKQFKRSVQSAIDLSTERMKESHKMFSEAERAVLKANPPSESAPLPPSPQKADTEEESTTEIELDDDDEPDMNFRQDDGNAKELPPSEQKTNTEEAKEDKVGQNESPNQSNQSLDASTPVTQKSQGSGISEKPKSPSIPQQAFAGLQRVAKVLNKPYDDTKKEADAIRKDFYRIRREVKDNNWQVSEKSVMEILYCQEKLKSLKEKYPSGYSFHMLSNLKKEIDHDIKVLEKVAKKKNIDSWLEIFAYYRNVKCNALNSVIEKLNEINHLQTEGVFRESGKDENVNKAFTSLLKDRNPSLPTDTHELTGVFKKLLDAPPPLMTREEGKKLFGKLNETGADAKKCIQDALGEIKKNDRVRGDMLEKVLILLYNAASKYNSNKMNGENIMISLNAAEKLFNMPPYTGTHPLEAAIHFQSINQSIGSAIDTGLMPAQKDAVQTAKSTEESASKSGPRSSSVKENTRTELTRSQSTPMFYQITQKLTTPRTSETSKPPTGKNRKKT